MLSSPWFSILKLFFQKAKELTITYNLPMESKVAGNSLGSLWRLPKLIEDLNFYFGQRQKVFILFQKVITRLSHLLSQFLH